MANDFFYKKVDAYKKAKTFIIYVYSLVRKFPAYEQYAICDQIRRSAVSIPSNIAVEVGKIMSGLRKSLIDKQNNCY